MHFNTDSAQWFKPHTPHMKLRAFGEVAVINGRVVSSPGRMHVLYETTSRPAGRRMKPDAI